MRLISKYKQKRYFYSLYFITTTTTILLVSLFLWTTFNQVKSQVYEREVLANKQLLEQLKSSIENTCASLEDVCFTIFNSYEAQSLMYSNKEVDYDIYQAINELERTFVNGTPYVHSVYLYNKTRDQYFSTFRNISNLDEDFQQRMKHGYVILEKQPTIRSIENQLIATYSLSDDFYYKKPTLSNSVYINFNFDWIQQNIDNLKNANSNQQLFIIDSSNKIINALSNNASKNDSNIINQLVNLNGLDEDTTLNMVVDDVHYFTSVVIIEKLGWKLIKIEPYDEVFKMIGGIRKTMILTNIIAVLAILGIFFILVKRLYKPLHKVINAIMYPKQPEVDEFSFIENFYYSTRTEIERLELLQKEVFLKELLLNNPQLSNEELGKEKIKNRIKLNFLNPCYILLLKIDDMEQLLPQFDLKKDKPLIRFTLRNIISEVIQENGNFTHEYIYMCESSIVNIIQDYDNQQQVIKLIPKLQKALSQFLNLSVSATISEEIMEYKCLKWGYEKCLQNFYYGFIMGRGAILLPEKIEKLGLKGEEDYNHAYEERFINLILKGSIKEAEEVMYLVMDEVALLKIADIQSTLLKFQQRLKEAVYEINEYSEDILDIEATFRGLDFEAVDYFDDYKEELHQFVLKIMPLNGKLNVKHFKLIKKLTNYISSHYSDTELSLYAISEEFRLSSSYVGKLFKKYEGMTITEYINHIRIEKSVELMKNTRLPISQIAQKVGYQNESYYFRLFKKKYNTTPRNYLKDIEQHGDR